ncbi:MAG: UvrD-helicase domain-containing protein [Verrucomicrobia bacterium]|nr:UvrD-helicase domain-containing protein [Verrucomicrobiota bacterium]
MDTLNPQQMQAVRHNEGPMLVLAGAGSGKTKVATLRIAALIASGVSPDKILGLTFTNKAAKEMKERVERYATHAVRISTFHSLGAKILRESITHLGFTSDFAIYDADDSEKLLKEVMRELNLEKALELKAVKSFISNAKNAFLSTDTEDDEKAAFFEVYRRYLDKLKSCNAVDFDDLLYLPVKLLKSFPQVLEIYQSRWSHFLVDEYQDTNGAQYLFIKLLIGTRRNLFVVGDPDQSIYSWRGANVRNILSFENDFPGAAIVRLEQNYRSTSTILKAANAVIKKNAGRYEKELWSALGDGEKIGVFGARSDREEASFVARTILSHSKEKGIGFGKMCVFYRTNFQSRVLEDELLSRKIPYTIVGGISFYLRKEIKDILSMLRLIDNPHDLISFLRVVNLPKRGFGETTLEKLQEAHAVSGLSILDFMLTHYQDDSFGTLPFTLTAKQKDGWRDFAKSFMLLKTLANGDSLKELVSAAVYQTRYVSVLDEDTPTKQERLENIEELIVKAAEWEEGAEEPTLSQFLEEISLVSSLDQADNKEESLHLMTLHNGKGLEFQVAFLIGVEEDLFPHINSKKDEKLIEEERRLFYVGLTRAKEHLFISYAQNRSLWGAMRRMRASRFLSEIPLYLLTSLSNYQSSSASQEPPQAVAPAAAKQSASFIGKVGDAVFHPQFGIGKIVSSQNGSLGLIYDVHFTKDNKTRCLVAKCAPLSLL